MKNIHENLCQKHHWYDSWHKNQNHNVVHWVMFIAVVALVGISISKGFAKSIQDPSLQVNEEKTMSRRFGAIPTDPEKLKKVPRLVATKDKTKIEPVAGESIITMASLATFPTSVNLATPPVANQGNEGSCVSFAVVYSQRSIEEYYKTNATSFNQATNIFSPEQSFNQLKSSHCSGSSLLPTMDLLTSSGVGTYQGMPYSFQNGCETLPNSEQVAEAQKFKIASYARITASDQTTIKTMLASNHPLSMMFTVDDAFYNAGPGFIWKTFTGAVGAHAIVIVGYDDTKHAYKIMNSWGTSWGDGGYSWIDYDFLPAVTTTVVSMSLPTSFDSVPPSSVLTSPSEGASISGTTTISAVATDTNAVAGVRFSVDGVTIATEDTSAPYSAVWNTSSFANGPHTIVAIARDVANNLTASAPVIVTVLGGDTTLPSSVSVSAPLAGSTVGGLQTVEVSAIDNSAIKEASIVIDGSIFTYGAQDIEPPFNFTVNTKLFTNGVHTLLVAAKDFANNVISATPIPVTFSNSTVAITSPINNATLFGVVQISATADNSLGVNRVDFYQGSTLIGSDNTSPYNVSWDTTTTQNGLYYLSAKAYDVANGVVTSSPVQAYVSNTVVTPGDSIAPTVSVTSPVNSAIVPKNTSLLIKATASDNVGVTRVEFRVNSSLACTIYSGAYDCSWRVPKGPNKKYSITARAYDAMGNSTTSSSVGVTSSR